MSTTRRSIISAEEYSPEDAQAHGARFETFPNQLTDQDIDPLMRPIIYSINKSGWVWTR
jgi:hypothetical protein